MGGGSKVCFLILLREFNKFEFFKDWGGGGSRPPTTPAHEHGYRNMFTYVWENAPEDKLVNLSRVKCWK